jgi:hypothetical protein
MNHVTHLLGPYIDGELRPSQLANIEKHLAICEACHNELEEFTRLSGFLHDIPQAENLKTEDQFLAEVGLLMYRKPENTLLTRVLTTGWKAIPVGLVATWAFVQTAIIVTGIIVLVTRLVPGAEEMKNVVNIPVQAGWASALCCSVRPLIAQILETAIQLLQIEIPLYWTVSVFIVFPFAIGTLFVCWLASWWVLRNRPIPKDSV